MNYKKNFLTDGYCKFSNLIDKKESIKLYNKIFKLRDWNKKLFLNEKDFLKNPQMKKTNPGKGVSNLLEKYNLDFIEDNTKIKKILETILGSNYEVVLKKFVVAVPEKWMPRWVKKINKKNLIGNFNPYIKKKFRDVTYFRGLDYHMDSIDWEKSNNQFITMYIYINKVTKDMSPLNVIKKSHVFGHDPFPHNIKIETKNNIAKFKHSKSKKFQRLETVRLTGNTGDLYIWTSNTLHGTSPSGSEDKDKFRISLRYLIRKNISNKKKTLVDRVVKTGKITKPVVMRSNYKKILSENE